MDGQLRHRSGWLFRRRHARNSQRRGDFVKSGLVLMQRVTQPARARSKRAGASAAPTDRWWSRTARSRSGTRGGDEHARRSTAAPASGGRGRTASGLIRPEAPVPGPVEVADPSRVVGHRGHPDPERVGGEGAAWRLCRVDSVTAALDPVDRGADLRRPTALPSSCPTAATLPSVNGATAVIAT